MLGSDVDANARSPRDRADVDPAVFDEQAVADEIDAVLHQRGPRQRS